MKIRRLEGAVSFQEFQKKIGYRFVLRRLEYPGAVRAGQMLPINSWWFNAGASPIYYDYTLAFQIDSQRGSAALVTSADVKQWLPVLDSTVHIPQTLKPGKYRRMVALLHPRTQEPSVQLAIQGRQPDGWYDLGEIKIQ